MDTQVAQKITDDMLNIVNEIAMSIAYVQEHCSEDEIKRYRRAVGRVTTAVFLDVLNPLFVMHPEVKPANFED